MKFTSLIPLLGGICLGLLVFSWAYDKYSEMLVDAKKNNFQYEYLIHDWFRNGIIISVGIVIIGLTLTIVKNEIDKSLEIKV